MSKLFEHEGGAVKCRIVFQISCIRIPATIGAEAGRGGVEPASAASPQARRPVLPVTSWRTHRSHRLASLIGGTRSGQLTAIGACPASGKVAKTALALGFVCSTGVRHAFPSDRLDPRRRPRRGWPADLDRRSPCRPAPHTVRHDDPRALDPAARITEVSAAPVCVQDGVCSELHGLCAHCRCFAAA